MACLGSTTQASTLSLGRRFGSQPAVDPHRVSREIAGSRTNNPVYVFSLRKNTCEYYRTCVKVENAK